MSRPPTEGDAGRDEPVPVTPLKASRDRYRLTPYSIPWLVVFGLLLIPYELVMVARDEPGGPLTYVVRWAYGEPLSIRWWLLGWSVTGFLLWLPPHFLFESVGLRWLIGLVLAGLVVGVAGWLFTR